MWRHQSEAGDTLIEVLLAVVILGISSVAILGAFANGLTSSTRHRDETNVGLVLAAAGESLANPALNPYMPCATTYRVGNGVTIPLSAAGVAMVAAPAVTSVSWWTGATFILSGTGTCPDTDVTLGGLFHLQVVKISVHSGDGLTTQSRTFLKRGP